MPTVLPIHVPFSKARQNWVNELKTATERAPTDLVGVVGS
jgi:hypothetical protein